MLTQWRHQAPLHPIPSQMVGFFLCLTQWSRQFKNGELEVKPE